MILLGVLNDPKQLQIHDQHAKVPKEIDKAVQTDSFVVYPYEHLFPGVLPQSINEIAQNKEVTSATNIFY